MCSVLGRLAVIATRDIMPVSEMLMIFQQKYKFVLDISVVMETKYICVLLISLYHKFSADSQPQGENPVNYP